MYFVVRHDIATFCVALVCFTYHLFCNMMLLFGNSVVCSYDVLLFTVCRCACGLVCIRFDLVCGVLCLDV